MREPQQTSTDGEKQSGRIPFSQQAWTLDTLKVHFDSRFEGLDRALTLMIEDVKNHVFTTRESDQEAIKVLASAFEKRMDTTNEWRAALEDQSKRLATIETVEGLKSRVETIEKKQEAVLNKVLGFGVLVTFVVAMVAIFGGVFGGGG